MDMRTVDVKPEDVDPEMAQEMASVGIIPSDVPHFPGYKFCLAGQQFVVIGMATREEFLAAVEAAGLNADFFRYVPEKFNFIRVSTD
jgi:hypothetical protein